MTAARSDNGTPAYRWTCASCHKTGGWVSSYGSAEHAAAEHTKTFRHRTFVVDHYGKQVVGSTQRPGSKAAGDEETNRW